MTKKILLLGGLGVVLWWLWKGKKASSQSAEFVKSMKSPEGPGDFLPDKTDDFTCGGVCPE